MASYEHLPLPAERVGLAMPTEIPPPFPPQMIEDIGWNYQMSTHIGSTTYAIGIKLLSGRAICLASNSKFGPSP